MNDLVAAPAAIALGQSSLPAPASDISASKDWHAIYTRHQHERSVAFHLQQLGIEVFLPLYRETHRWSDRRKQVVLPLIPCYVFFAGGLQQRLQILSTPGVCSLVASGGKIAVIPAFELQALQRTMNSNLPVRPHPFVQVGDRIRVRSGPLAGLEGIIARVKDSMRIVLSIQTLCRSVAVEVDEAAVDRVPAA